jgi:hypothetical protein
MKKSLKEPEISKKLMKQKVQEEISYKTKNMIDI